MQQTVMADMTLKLSKPEHGILPPLLPSLLTSLVFSFLHHQTPLIQSGHLSQPLARLPKLEVHLFLGEHVISWLFQIKHFFTHHSPLPGRLEDFHSHVLYDGNGLAMVLLAFLFGHVDNVEGVCSVS